MPGPLELLDEEEQPAAIVPDAVASESGGGDLEWWHALLIATGVGVAFFAVGFGVARIAARA